MATQRIPSSSSGGFRHTLREGFYLSLFEPILPDVAQQVFVDSYFQHEKVIPPRGTFSGHSRDKEKYMKQEKEKSLEARWNRTHDLMVITIHHIDTTNAILSSSKRLFKCSNPFQMTQNGYL